MQRAELLALAPTIRAIADAHGATNLAVFGSVARDQAGPTSDLDLLVDLPPAPGCWSGWPSSMRSRTPCTAGWI